jgi:hypothetical protein
MDFTMSRNTALLLSPLIGLLVVLSTLALSDSPNRGTIAGLGLPVMLIFLLAHRSSTKRAAR